MSEYMEMQKKHEFQDRLLMEALLRFREYAVMPQLLTPDEDRKERLHGDSVWVTVPGDRDALVYLSQQPYTMTVLPHEILESMRRDHQLYPPTLDEGVKTLAEAFDRYVMQVALEISPIGDLSITPFQDGTIRPFIEVRREFEYNLVPKKDRAIVLTPEAEACFMTLPMWTHGMPGPAGNQGPQVALGAEWHTSTMAKVCLALHRKAIVFSCPKQVKPSGIRYGEEVVQMNDMHTGINMEMQLTNLPSGLEVRLSILFGASLYRPQWGRRFGAWKSEINKEE